MTAPPALELRGVVVRHGRRAALAGVDLTAPTGETLALVGPNGAGKSTLLHVAALLRRPDEGEVWIAGERATRANERRLMRGVAIVFQRPILFSTTVLANAALGLRMRGVGRADAERTARAWLGRFGVGGLAGRRAREISGGEAQRAALARAFALEPRLLLLDEPFASLDAPTRAALLPDLAAQLVASGTTAVLVTHDLHEALALGSRMGLLIDGRLAQEGPAAAVMARPASGAIARLLGVENLLPGRVLGPGGAGWSVCLDGSDRPVRAASAAFAPAAGSRALLALRAGAIRLLPTDALPLPGWNGLPGRARETRPAASGIRVMVDAGPALEAALPWAPDAPPPAPGDPVLLAFPPEAAHLLPDEPAPSPDPQRPDQSRAAGR